MQTLTGKAVNFTLLAALLLLGGCSESSAPEASAVVPPMAAEAKEAAVIAAPAGRYKLDPNHANLSFSLRHLGLSNYVLRFTRYTVDVDLDPANLAASSVVVTIDPTSVRSDFSGDYVASHPGTKFQSWDEALAQSDNFLASAQYPEIVFRSTGVEPKAAGNMRISGDLTLHGQTHPLVLEAKVVGSLAAHPMMPGVGMIGFSATGSFQRSMFGMDYLLSPPILGDKISLSFEGEFQQQVSTP